MMVKQLYAAIAVRVGTGLTIAIILAAGVRVIVRNKLKKLLGRLKLKTKEAAMNTKNTIKRWFGMRRLIPRD